jgi:cytochrome c-type biogenesis protein CcmH/NrfF
MRAIVAATVLALCFLPTAAGAQDSPNEVASRVSQEVMSPFCDGVTLHDCPSQQADELRLEIASWARAGLTEDQILMRLEDRYGSVISGTPGNPLAWFVPFAAVAAGVALVTVLARRWGREEKGHSGDPELQPMDRARVEAELAAHRNRRW